MDDVYAEFFTKKPCMEYVRQHNLAFFQRDINKDYKKLFIADTYENIYNKIINGQNNYYESWISPQPQNMKFYIDYDKKTPNTADTSQTTLSYKNDIYNIINKVRELIPNITDVYILKSIPDIEKKSYHIIFDGVHFTSYKSIKSFVEDRLKPLFKELFENKIVDTSVYEPKCFRSLLCTKFGQNRPLYLLETEPFMQELSEVIIEKEATTLDHFLKTCLTYIRPDSILFDYRSEKKKVNSKKVHLNEQDVYSDKDIVKKYIDILDPSRYTDRNKWLNVGYIIYSINPDYNDVWHYFSYKWEHYNQNDADIAWNSFANTEYIYTINNLIHLAKIDNPEECDELSKDIPNHDLKFLRPFDNILSKLIYRLYGEKFICSDCDKNIWYYFNGIRWKLENKSYNLRHKTINEVFNMIENYRRQLVKEGASEEIIKNYHHILQKLGSGIKLNCLELEFYNSNFYKIIDQDKDLLGFDNGIYDLKMMQFRSSTSSDYISLSTNYEFHEINESDPSYVELMVLICKILPEASVRHFTLKSLASCLDGHTRDENFYIWSGKNSIGGSGKSTLTDLLLKSLGDYGSIAPITLITKPRESANSANSALYNTRNKRAIIFQEPSSKDYIQSDIIKSLTGGDLISCRELNSSQIEFKPHFKMFVCTNRLPNITETDGGTMRRLKITEFTSKFVDNPKNEFEYKIDRELKNKLDDYKLTFMNIMIYYYGIYKREGLTPPERVVQVTKKYENNNNVIKAFVDDNLTVTHSKNEYITKSELKNLYKADYTVRNSFPKFTNFVTDFENYMCSEFKMDKKGLPRLYGACIKQNCINSDDDIETEL